MLAACAAMDVVGAVRVVAAAPFVPVAVRHRRCGESAYGHHARRTVRERSRLVEGHALDLGKPLQRIAFAHQHAEFGEVADGGHDGGRG